MKTISVTTLKANLSATIREVEGGSAVLITRRGQPVAALVPIEEAKRLKENRRPDRGLASLAGGWEGSDELVRAVESASRSRTRGVEPLV